MDVGRIYYKMGTINSTASIEYLNHKYSQVARIYADWWESTMYLYAKVEAENNITLQAKQVEFHLFQKLEFHTMIISLTWINYIIK